MLRRIISGIIAGAILIVLMLLPPYVLALTALVASIIGLFELSNALKQKNIHIDMFVSIVSAVVIMGKAYGVTIPVDIFPGLSEFFTKAFAVENLNAFFYILALYLFCRIIFDRTNCHIEDIAYTLLGIVYIPFLLSFAVMIRNLERGFEFIWLVLIGSMMTDIFAYFVGVSIGKTKIIPHISPKKTVEGSIGGAIGCMLIMILYGAIIMNRQDVAPISLHHFAIMGLLCGVVAQLGDWAASAIKRYTAIKDFGNLIPGHGGIMDRADSILFVSPLVYIYVSLFLC
ncbi:MAG: phosphatidate cytidylyltransferase [Acetivibrionales bacterium]|jgi:phosphatidate cytidylyltransferase|nr:phosphatidate cytidylyltransferase [Clostridiaceae bacterium]